MIGPRAHEWLFQTALPKTYVYGIYREGKAYSYTYDWETIEMFESMTAFKEWCIKDVEERQGKYADRIETVYKSAERSETMNGDDKYE